MSYDLFSLNDRKNPVNINMIIWIKLLDLSEMYGWEPLGTLHQPISRISVHSKEKIKNWEGSYFTNDGQIITTEDALALANGLEAALDDIPDIETTEKMIDLREGSDLSGFGYAKEICQLLIDIHGGSCCLNGNLHPFDFFSGDMKQEVIDFISFCKNGGFMIW